MLYKKQQGAIIPTETKETKSSNDVVLNENKFTFIISLPNCSLLNKL